MSRYISNEKNAFLFLLWFTFFGTMFATAPIFGLAPVGRAGHPLSSSEIAAYNAYKDRKALEAYEKRNAGIDSWIKDDEIPDHGNAALLYYQALLLQPDHDQAVLNKFYDVYGDAEPNMAIKTFLGQWLPSMKISEVASRMPECTWAVWPEQVWPEEKTSRVFLIESFKDFSYIIAVDAITLASEAHYCAALERCMTLRRIGRHLSYDSGLHLLSNACDSMALRTIRCILAEMPLDTDILTWLKVRLDTFQEYTTLLEGSLQKDLKAKIDMVQSYSIPRLRGMLLKRAPDERTRQQIRNLTDDQIRNQALHAVHGSFDSIFATLHSNKSVEQKYTEIREATDYTKNKDTFELLIKIDNNFGGDIYKLIPGRDIEMTEEQKLSEIQKIIDKSAEPDTIELLTRFSKVLGKDINFDFLVNREMTDKQKCDEMQKVIHELGDAYAIETSTFGLSWYQINFIESEMDRHTAQMAQINCTKAAVELYLIMAKTGQLPKELPDNLPKDPFTGRDLLYKIRDYGFILGCRSEIFKRGKERFAFQIRKKSN
jgi:hypothetical protein